MVPKQKNLLEAFRDAGGSGSEEGTSSAGPFAGPPAGSSKADPPPPSPPSSIDGEKTALPPWVPLVLVGVLCFVLGLTIGRSTGTGDDEVNAGNPADPTDETTTPRTSRTWEPNRTEGNQSSPTPDPNVNANSPGSSSTPATTDPVAALRDPANEYTVVAVTYGGSQEEHARATQRLLAELGLPAFPPVKSGSYLLVLVGASPTTGGLSDVLRRVQGAEDWTGAKAFQSAYVSGIDKVLDR